MIYNGTVNDYGKVCSSCAVYIAVTFLIIIGISSTYFYFY